MSPTNGDEPRTPRQMRLAIREAEETLRLLQESSMMAGDWEADWSLNAARAKLRKAERHFATKDQHKEPLKPLSPRVRKPRPQTEPRQRRCRCTGCFAEALFPPDRERKHSKLVGKRGNYERVYCGDWEPLARMPAGGSEL